MSVNHTFIVYLDKTTLEGGKFSAEAIKSYLGGCVIETMLEPIFIENNVDESFIDKFFSVFEGMVKYHLDKEKNSIAFFAEIPSDFDFCRFTS